MLYKSQYFTLIQAAVQVDSCISCNISPVPPSLYEPKLQNLQYYGYALTIWKQRRMKPYMAYRYLQRLTMQLTAN